MNEIKRNGVGARMSQSVVANGIAWLAGQVGDPSHDVAQQTQDCLDKIDALLADLGADKTRIVSAQIWMADMANDFATMNAVWDKWVAAGHAPARATGEARLATPEHLVEIIVTAAL